MLRSFLLAGALSAALFSAAAPAQTTLQLLEPGAAPRQAIRYRFNAGHAEQAALDLNVQMAMSLAGQVLPLGAVPPIRMIMAMRTAEVAADGSARIEFELLSAEAAGDDAQAAQMNQALSESTRGLSGWYRVDARGQVSDSEVKAPDDGSASAVLQDLEQSMQQMAAPFPEEAVGPGARWRVTQHVTNSNMQMTQTAEYTLRSRAGNRIELDVKMVDASLDAVAGLPPGARLDSVKMEGGGTSSIQLDRLVPTGSVEANLQLGLSITAEGPTQSMGMNLKMKQAISPQAP
jgi:hypothetical protein|nr:MAG: hypothetical protein DIU62_08095 [Pseudomonadota bacterium]